MELTDGEENSIRVARLMAEAEAIPGVVVSTGVRCRAVKPAPPHVHNIYMTECHGKLLNHDGPHSWEWATGGD